MPVSLKTKITCFLVTLFASSTTPLLAGAQVSPLNAIYTCASIIDDTERLACFDRNVPVIKIKEEKKEIIAIDSEGVKAIERDSFGFSLPSLPKLGLFTPKTEKTKKSAQFFDVKSISKGRNGAVLTMENGHVWRQINGDLGYIPKGNLTAKIKPASLNTFFISLKNEKGQSGRKGARFKRVE